MERVFMNYGKKIKGERKRGNRTEMNTGSKRKRKGQKNVREIQIKGETILLFLFYFHDRFFWCVCFHFGVA